MAENTPVKEGEQKPKPKLPLKTILFILGILVMEGGTITIFKIVGGGPKPAQGSDPIVQPVEDPGKNVAELSLASGTVDNYVSGRTLIRIDLEVHAKVPKTDFERLKTVVAEHKTEIQDRIRFLVSSAQPEDIKDPKLQVIKREIKNSMEEIIGPDLIQEILLPTWQSFTME